MNNNEENVLLPLQGNNITFRGSPRLLRSPPQPHMCVQDMLQGTDIPCFINVMSWHKIGVPMRPEDPTPLFGGVKVPLSDRSSVPSYVGNCQQKPLVFAVVVNPQVLQQSGKNAENPEETASLVDMVLDFVEAMNKDVKLTRKFKVLKDRDLTGELKDIWGLIQEKRDQEKSNIKIKLWQSLTDENCQPCGAHSVTTQINTKPQRNCQEGEESQEPIPHSIVCQNLVINNKDEANLVLSDTSTEN